MLIQQRQSMSTAAAGMGPVNALQHPQDSAILHLHLGTATSREHLPDQARHVGARADFLLTSGGSPCKCSLCTRSSKSTTEEEYRKQINEENLSPDQIRLNREAIDRTRQEIGDLRARLGRVAKRARQAARSRYPRNMKMKTIRLFHEPSTDNIGYPKITF